MNFGDRLIELRKDHGYTREAFAKHLGISKYTLRNYELSVNEPGSAFLKEISDMFNISIDYLLGLTDEKEVLRSFRLKKSEYSHIEKYRNLDKSGQQHVDEVLTWETDRMELLSQQAQYIAQLEKLASIDVIQDEPCRPIRFYQTYPSPATGKVMWDDIKIDNTEIPDNDDNKEGDYLITMDDDSMAPLFWKTDILLVKETDKIELGEIGVFTLNGVCYIKELGKNKLISRNPDFPPIMFDKSLECKGKVLRNLMEHTEDEIKYLTERKDHIRRYQETYEMVAENGLNDDDETRKLVKKIVDSLKETPDSND